MKYNKTLALFFTGIFFILTGQHIQAQDSDTTSLEVAKKIRDVENSLAGVDGSERDSSWNILDRMSHYNIPGVSIAVIHTGYRENGEEVVSLFYHIGIHRHFPNRINLLLVSKK